MSQNNKRHGPGGVPQKPKNFKEAIGKLGTYCRPYYTAIIIAMICALVSAIFTIIGPDKLRDLTNIIIQGALTGIDFDALLGVCWLLVFFYGTSALLGLIQGIVMTNTTQNISRKLRGDISKKINRLPVSYFNRTSFGDVLSRVTNDVDMIGDTLHRSVTQLTSAAALLVGSLFMMFKTNSLLAITSVAASLVGFALMMVIMSHSQKYFTANQNNLGKLNGNIEEIYSGHNIVRVYNGEKKAIKNFDELNKKLCDSSWKSQFFSGLMMPIMNFIGNFGYVAVCVVGALLVHNGTIDFGVVVAFMIYVRLFTNPLSQIAQAATSLQSTAAASERVFEFLGETEMSDESAKTASLSDIRGEIDFEHVTFSYPDSESPVIHDFNEHINPGQKVAIVGPTGAGKTTMVSLLMRFYEINGGSIMIDGIPTSELTRANIHDLFGMVLQDTWIFEGTIRENIVYSKKNVSDETLDEVCRAVGLYHFIHTLPNGYDTPLDDNTALSAGQKQLVTIARAMIENAPMLILDEATSSVDTRTEELIQQAMDKLTEGRTSFVIAHRLSTIKNADKILVMKDGDVIESGTHDELLAAGGFYSTLYNSQFEQAS